MRNKVLSAEVRIIAHLVVQVGGGTNRGLSQIQQFGLQLLYRELGDLVRSGDLMAETGCLKRYKIEILSTNQQHSHLSVNVLSDFLDDDVWVIGEFLRRRGGGVSVLVEYTDFPRHHSVMYCYCSTLALLLDIHITTDKN